MFTCTILHCTAQIWPDDFVHFNVVLYMLATDEVWHDQSSNNVPLHVYPHIMVYAPYLKNADIGVAPEQVWRPDRVWIQYEGRPDAYLIFEVGASWAKP